MRRLLAALVVCCAIAAGLLVFTPGKAPAAPAKVARKSSHARALHARQRAAHLRRARRLRTARRRVRNRIITTAWRAVGVPYRWGGSSMSGFDCSGLTRWVYGQVGVSLPHYSVAQWSYGRRVSRRALRPGDLLFFSGLGHVGIYLGHGAVIHAPRPGERVRMERMGGWLGSSFYGARRLRLAG